MTNIEEIVVREIAREVLQEEIKNCAKGIENTSQLREHERRICGMELNLKESTEKVSKEVSRITWYIIAVLGAIITEGVTLAFVILPKLIEAKP